MKWADYYERYDGWQESTQYGVDPKEYETMDEYNAAIQRVKGHKSTTGDDA